MKVLADKGMVEMKPRWGTRATPRSRWRLLDPDILAWEAEMHPAPQFLRDLCEVRLAIEPTAAGFAAVRATEPEMAAIAGCLQRREAMTGKARFDEMVELDLCFHAAIVEASHNPLFRELNSTIREPFRTALGYTSRFPANLELGLEAHRALMDALRRRDPLQSKSASEKVVGLAMLAVEEVISARKRK
jgi:DNA-binding FadR family transcriptional regulator